MYNYINYISDKWNVCFVCIQFVIECLIWFDLIWNNPEELPPRKIQNLLQEVFILQRLLIILPFPLAWLKHLQLCSGVDSRLFYCLFLQRRQVMHRGWLTPIIRLKLNPSPLLTCVLLSSSLVKRMDRKSGFTCQ